MRTISSGLKQALIDGTRAMIVTITCADNTVYGYTDHDMPLTVVGVTYKPAPGLQKVSLNATADSSVTNQEIAAAWVDAPEDQLLAGKFDNAVVEVALCSWADTSLGKMIVERGHLGVIQWTKDGFRADLQGIMRDLQRNINFTHTATCRHLLFSQFDAKHIGACTLNKSSYEYTVTVSAVTDKHKFSVTGLSQPNEWCTNGTVTWLTGSNANLSGQVKAHTVGSTTDIELFLPAFITINIGDTLKITAGCDKTFATCQTKFNNAVNFGGFPHIQTEATIQ